MLEFLQFVSIAIEAIIVVLCLFIGYKKKACFGYCLALTFAIYVFYDLAKQLQLAVSLDVLNAIFFVASLSALCAVGCLLKGDCSCRQ